VKIVIPILQKISLNKIYAGIHWQTRMEHVDEADSAITFAPRITEYTGKYPVYVHYHFRLAGTALDISNHAYMVKLVEDSMVKHGVIKGDQPKYVAGIFTTAEKVPLHSLDEVEVTISPYPPVFPSSDTTQP
jgi:hypothetical protein